MNVEFDNAQKIVFDKSRWVMKVTVIDSEGEDHVYVASAGLDGGDQLWFGTLEEYEEALDESWGDV